MNVQKGNAESSHGRRQARLLRVLLFLLLAATLAGSTGIWLAYWYSIHRVNVTRSRIDREWYESRIASSIRAVGDRKFSRARRLLEHCPASHRNWEWGRLQYVCNRDVLTIDVYTSPVRCTDMTRDGRRVIAASDDGIVKIWDTETGNIFHELEGHSDEVWSAFFDREGIRAITAGDDRTARIWNVQSGDLVHTLRGHTKTVRFAQFSDDGRRAVTASWDRTVRIWDVESGRQLLKLGPLDRILAFAIFAPDDRTILTLSYGESPTLWDADTGRQVLSLDGHKDLVWSAQFSLDGRRIVTASRDTTARIWDAKSGQELDRLEGHTGDVAFAAFSPDGRLVATAAYDETARIWDAERGVELHTLEAHGDNVFFLAFSPDGRRLATTSFDQTTRLWDVETGREVLLLEGHDKAGHPLVFDDKGDLLVTGSDDGTVKLWDPLGPADPRPIGDEYAIMTSFSYTADGQRVVSSHIDGAVRIWEYGTGRLLSERQVYDGELSGARFSLDGTRFAAITDDGMLFRYTVEPNPGDFLSFAVQGTASSVSFSPYGKLLAAGTDDAGILVVDSTTGQEKRRLRRNRDEEFPVAEFAPDGKSIAGAGPGRTVAVWNAETGKVSKTFKGHDEAVARLSFSHDGSRLAAGGAAGTVWVWDMKTGRLISRFNDEDTAPQPVLSLAFSADSSRVAIAEHTRASLWNVNAGRRIMPFREPLSLHFDCIVFSPDGRDLVTAGNEGMKVWSAYPWRTADLPGVPDEDYATRLRRHRLEDWKKRRAARLRLSDDVTSVSAPAVE